MLTSELVHSRFESVATLLISTFAPPVTRHLLLELNLRIYQLLVETTASKTGANYVN